MTAAVPRPGQYKMLDAWRGVAALWVVLFHAGAVLSHRFTALGELAVYRFCEWGHLGVQLFFVISGYCIANAACVALRDNRGVGAFLRARARRVYVPCWFSLPFYAAVAIVAGVLTQRGILHASALGEINLLHQGPLFYIANLTLTQVPLRQPFLSLVCWTLCYEVAFYLIVALALWVAALWTARQTNRDTNINGERLLLDSLHVLTLLMLVALWFAPRRVFYPFDLWPQFGLGLLVYDVLTNRAQVRPKAVMGAACLLTFAVALRWNEYLGVAAQPSRAMFLTGAVFALILIALHRQDSVLAAQNWVRPFAAIGRFSYSLYLVHFLVIGVVMQLLLKTGWVETWHYACLLVLIVSALTSGWLFYCAFEKPFLSAHRKRISAAAAASVAVEPVTS